MDVSSRMDHKPTNQEKRQRWEKVRLKKERKTERSGKGVFPHCKPISIYCVFSDPGCMLGLATEVNRPYCSKPTNCWKRSTRGCDHQLTKSWTWAIGGFLYPPLSLEFTFHPPFSQWEPFQGQSIERAMCYWDQLDSICDRTPLCTLYVLLRF